MLGSLTNLSFFFLVAEKKKKKEVSSRVQKIEGPLWKVPRCQSMLLFILDRTSNVLAQTSSHLLDGFFFFPIEIYNSHAFFGMNHFHENVLKM